MREFVSRFFRAYCYRMPVEAGKWRLVQQMERDLQQKKVVEKRNVELPGGFRMLLSIEDFIQRTIYLTGHWEPHIEKQLEHWLRPGDTFVDIGANVGYFSLLAARLVSPSGKVIAFEPNTSCFNMLQNNISLNKLNNISPYCLGIGDRRAEVPFFINTAGNVGGSSLWEGSHSGESAFISIDTLDDVVARQNIGAIRLVKIDVEGSETLVLKGMEKLMRSPSSPAIICEISEFGLEKMGSSKKALFDLIAQYGYRPKIISPIRQSIFQGSNIYFHFDVLMVKQIEGAHK